MVYCGEWLCFPVCKRVRLFEMGEAAGRSEQIQGFFAALRMTCVWVM